MKTKDQVERDQLDIEQVWENFHKTTMTAIVTF